MLQRLGNMCLQSGLIEEPDGKVQHGAPVMHCCAQATPARCSDLGNFWGYISHTVVRDCVSIAHYGA